MVLDAIRQWFVDGASAGPSLLVVEDLHWSTSTTRNVLRHLARRAGRAPLLVVTTARDSKPDFDADLVALLADLERLPSVRRLSLSGLDRDEVGELVGSTADEAEAIRADTGGNPLLVTHMSSYAGQRSLPAWLVRRDALLDDESRAVLDQAATFGSEFDADRLAAAHGAPLLRVLECLEAADAAGLVAPHPVSDRVVHVRARPVPRPSIRRVAAAATARAPRASGRRAGHAARRHARPVRAGAACLSGAPAGRRPAGDRAGPRRRPARRAELRVRRGDRPLPAWTRGGPPPGRRPMPP